METRFDRSKLVAGLVGVIIAAGVGFYVNESTDLPLIGLGSALVINAWVFSSMVQRQWVRVVVLLGLAGPAIVLIFSVHWPLMPDLALATMTAILFVLNIVMYLRKRNDGFKTMSAMRD